jgi:sulfopyruvate decarboxylase TPP-binding subunit
MSGIKIGSQVATSVPAADLHAAIDAADITHVVTVPDTHQRTLLSRLSGDPARPLVRAASEDDVFGVCTGLWMAGHRPLAVVQQLGLFAAANSLRWAAHDARTPLAVVAGLYGRSVGSEVSEDPASAVRLAIPLLQALQIRSELIESPAQLERVTPLLRDAFDAPGVRVVLLGAPTE